VAETLASSVAVVAVVVVVVGTFIVVGLVIVVVGSTVVVASSTDVVEPTKRIRNVYLYASAPPSWDVIGAGISKGGKAVTGKMVGHKFKYAFLT